MIKILGYVLVCIIFLYSFLNFILLIWNLIWLLKDDEFYFNKNLKEFAICIPVLREQRMIRQCLEYFSSLNYPKDKYKIFVVTTKKEDFERGKNRSDLKLLALDIFEYNLSKIEESYLHLFNLEKLKDITKNTKGKKYSEILNYLTWAYDTYPSTNDIAIKVSNELNKKYNIELVNVIHYPYDTGYMADQINYLIKYLNNGSIVDLATFFAIYNIDSAPNRDTLREISKEITLFENKHSLKLNVVQQSSLFTKNLNKISGILRGAALLQTKWTLVHELSRLRKQSASVSFESKTYLQSFIRTKLGHCVGHGLFVRLDYFKDNMLPTDTINEDLPYGFYQSVLKEPILPVKVLENSDSPESFRSLINQKKVWFWPYVEYFKCRNSIKLRVENINNVELNTLFVKAIFSGLVWFMQSLVFLLPLFVVIFYLDFTLLCLYLLSWVLYWTIPVSIILIYLPSLEGKASGKINSLSTENILDLTVNGFLTIFTHSIGPILCVIEFCKIKLFKTKYLKLKTER